VLFSILHVVKKMQKQWDQLAMLTTVLESLPLEYTLYTSTDDR